MSRDGKRTKTGRPTNLEGQLALVTEHLERVKDVAIGLGESRGIWTASAAEVLAAYIQEETDAALLALKQLRPLITQTEIPT
jgi:hypothetical protein